MVKDNHVYIHPNPSWYSTVEVNWKVVPQEHWGTVAFYTDVFSLLGQGSLGLSQEMIDIYRDDIEMYTRDMALDVRKEDARITIDRLLIPEHQDALLARYVFDGEPTRLPRRTYEDISTLLNITPATAPIRVIVGIQDVRAVSDAFPIGGLYTIPGQSSLGNHRRDRF